ncbi:MAG: CRISPR-associated protein Csy1 [Lentimonas sp.]|jgi:CRISPR-associated protein Csy1
MNSTITEFLLERKNVKIKDKIKPNLYELEKQNILDELEEKFSLENWLPDAAKRATWLTMVSHPSKFSHPDAKTSSIISENKRANDGYLRSGNVSYGLDVFGNAAALDVYKFLNLKMSDGETILNHLEKDSDEIKKTFLISTANYEDLKKGLLSIKQSDNSGKTDRLVKQVYFPASQADPYHLLSILTPSGLITTVKERIDKMRFSEETKKSKEDRKNNHHNAAGFDDIFDLTIIGYGGTKPQNISILNSQNGGRSYLLPSLPPQIKKRNVNFPKYNFFKNSLWINNFKDNFEYLNKVIHDNRNNIKIRNFRKELIKSIFDEVLQSAVKIRFAGKDGWSNDEIYQNLPFSQKIWLDNAYENERQETEKWIDEVSSDFARWVIFSYEKLLKEKAQKLSDYELKHIKEEAKETILITRGFN